MRRFAVFRRGDLSETHDANQVNAPELPQYEGVVFSDGTVAVRWLTAARSTSVWADFDTLMRVHGHTDANSKHGTEIRFHDEVAHEALPPLTDRGNKAGTPNDEEETDAPRAAQRRGARIHEPRA